MPKQEVVATLTPGSISAFPQDAASMQKPEASFKDGYWSQAMLGFGASRAYMFPRAQKAKTDCRVLRLLETAAMHRSLPSCRLWQGQASYVPTPVQRWSKTPPEAQHRILTVYHLDMLWQLGIKAWGEVDDDLLVPLAPPVLLYACYCRGWHCCDSHFHLCCCHNPLQN